MRETAKNPMDIRPEDVAELLKITHELAAHEKA